MCLTADAKVGHAHLEKNAKKDIIHFDVVNYLVVTWKCGPT